VRQGKDPIDERDGRKVAAKQAEQSQRAVRQRKQLTLCRASRDYHERVIEPKMSAKHGADWILSLENHVPAGIWNAPIETITAPALLQALTEVRSVEDPSRRVPETLQRVRQRLDAVFEDAIFHCDRTGCTTNPAAAIRRKMRETLPAKKAGEFRALPYREVAGFMAKLRAAKGVGARCLEFALLTASRTNETLKAEWSEFDFSAGTWIVPGEKMKAKVPHTAYLSDAAIGVLQLQRGLDDRFVFPSLVGTGKPISNMAMLTTLDRLGMRQKTTVHGVCRATFSTWANDTAAARPEVIEAALAHRESDKVRAAYNRAEFAEERRALMKAWAAFLLAQCDGANVVPIRAA
jgi:integrase